MTSSSTKPVVVLVHGTWHRPIHFLPFILRLRKEGFTVVAPANASAGWDDSTAEKTLKDDAAVIKAATQPYLDAGRELIFVCHSYGSLPATDCIVGNSVEERKEKGLPGGVKAIVSIAAVVPLKAGQGIMDQIGLVPGGSGHYDPPPTWWAVDGVSSASYVRDDEVEIEITSNYFLRLIQTSFHQSIRSNICTATSIPISRPYLLPGW